MRMWVRAIPISPGNCSGAWVTALATGRSMAVIATFKWEFAKGDNELFDNADISGPYAGVLFRF